MDKKATFRVVNDEGKEIECEVLFTFESDETKKNYLVYTDNTTDELGNIKVYANTYDPYSDSGSLGELETDEEWATIEQIFDSIKDNKELLY